MHFRPCQRKKKQATIDWSKLVNKPPVFGENVAADDDIRLFRELTQFLVTMTVNMRMR